MGTADNPQIQAVLKQQLEAAGALLGLPAKGVGWKVDNDTIHFIQLQDRRLRSAAAQAALRRALPEALQANPEPQIRRAQELALEENSGAFLILPCADRAAGEGLPAVGILLALPKPLRPTPAQWEGLHAIADLGKAAFYGLHTRKEAQLRRSRLQTVASVTRDATVLLAPEELLKRGAELICKQCGFYHAAIYMIDEKREYAVLKAAHSPEASKLLAAHYRQQISGEGLISYVARTGQGRLADDVNADGLYLHNPYLTNTRAELTVPMRYSNEVIGVLDVQSVAAEAFTEDDFIAFQIMADQLANALVSARLHHHLQQRLQETLLLRKIMLQTATLAPRAVLEGALELLCDILPFPYQAFSYKQHGQLALLSHANWPQTFETCADALWEHTQSGKTLWRSSKAVLSDCSDKLRTLIAVPVRINNETLALLMLAHTAHEPETKNMLYFLEALAAELGILLYNAQLLENLKSQQQELRHAYDEAQYLNEVRAQMVQNVSHELRTPLTIVMGYLEMLLDGALGPVSEQQSGVLRTVYARAKSLKHMIQSLTTFQQQLRPENITLLSLNDLLMRVLQEFQEIATQGHAHFYVEIAPDLPPISGDAEQLHLVFMHLIDNAIKFSPNGGAILIRGQPQANYVVIAITDHGIGIAPQHQAHIFERFYQADGTTTRRYGGMGIGLALVWEIIEAHGGQVAVESAPQAGSTFTVHLPLQPELMRRERILVSD